MMSEMVDEKRDEKLVPKETKPEPQDISALWGVEFAPFICEYCDWAFLGLPKDEAQNCPHCFEQALAPPVEGTQDLLYPYPPELYLSFDATEELIAQKVAGFARGIPFAPQDLSMANLTTRMRRVFLPAWLVDTKVEAPWQAEVGFDYDVVSHQDRYEQNRGGWTSREITETRIRWEPRLGRLSREYENVLASALEVGDSLLFHCGEFDQSSAQTFEPSAVAEAWIWLPDRTTEDAWPDAVPVVRTQAMEECKIACGADHIRDFRWTPEYRAQSWTQVLFPIYSSYYLDDEGQAQPVLLHGQSGQIRGSRRGSLKRARTVSLALAFVAILLGFFSLLGLVISVLSAVLLPFAILGLILAFIVGFVAIIPIALVWQFNRRQRRG
jgi:hypothetical protein